MNKVIIFGHTGQDGYYLKRLLIKNGDKVFGISRSKKTYNLNFSHSDNFVSYSADILDKIKINELISEIKPHSIYYLAGESSVGKSFSYPQSTINTNTLGFINILEAVKNNSHHSKVFNALSSECFGETLDYDASEDSALNPGSPYALSKKLNYDVANYYSKNYDLQIYNIFLFNHESVRRNENFVTQKIISSVKLIYKKKINHLLIGNIDIIRDWGWAPEFVKFFPKILSLKDPDNFILATGKPYALSDFIKFVFEFYDLNFENYIQIDPSLKRDSDPKKITANISKIKRILGDHPKVSLPNIVENLLRSIDD